MNFKSQLDDNIQKHIQNFCQHISSKYKLNYTEVYETWNLLIEESSDKPTKKTPPKKSPLKKTSVKTDESPPKQDTIIKINNVCPYVFSKGARNGEQCGCKPKNGNVYCCKHKKYEDTKEKKIETKKPVEKIGIILRKHKITGKLWHMESGLVFKSVDERIVTGKITNDIINPLTDEDVQECKKLNFKYELVTEEQDKPETITEEQDKPETITDVKKLVCKALSLEENTISSTKKKMSASIKEINNTAQNVEDILSQLQDTGSELDYQGVQEEDLEEDFLEEEQDEEWLEEEI